MRTAKCSCGRTAQSSPDLAFFVSRVADSEPAKRTCKNCFYFDVAHSHNNGVSRGPGWKTVIELGKCKGFEPHGEFDHDLYYCGCWGWD